MFIYISASPDLDRLGYSLFKENGSFIFHEKQFSYMRHPMPRYDRQIQLYLYFSSHLIISRTGYQSEYWSPHNELFYINYLWIDVTIWHTHYQLMELVHLWQPPPLSNYTCVLMFLINGIEYSYKIVRDKTLLLTTQSGDAGRSLLLWTWRLIHMKFIARMSETIFMCSYYT